jgi:NADH:ubiquinone oxidoreductase subunit C
MIIKKQTTLETLLKDIESFYKKKEHHFLTLNGVRLDETTTEIQWIFSSYGKVSDDVIFFVNVKQDDIIPSVVSILPSAIISQREIVDMFGIVVENSEKGLYLDEDSESMPLGSCGI